MAASSLQPVLGTLPLEEDEFVTGLHEQCGWVYGADKRFPLHTGCNVIGRAAVAPHAEGKHAQCEASWARKFGKEVVRGIFLEAATVSSTHLMLEVAADGTVCEAADLGSSNGSWLWGETSGLRFKPHKHHVLRNGDVLKLGSCELCIEFMHVRKFAASQQAGQLLQPQLQHLQQQEQQALESRPARGGSLQQPAERPLLLQWQQPQDSETAAAAAGGASAGGVQHRSPASHGGSAIAAAGGGLLLRPDQISTAAAHPKNQHALSGQQQQQVDVQHSVHVSLAASVPAAAVNAGGIVSPAVPPAASHAINVHGGATLVFLTSPPPAAVPHLLSGAPLAGLLRGPQQAPLQPQQQQQQQVEPQQCNQPSNNELAPQQQQQQQGLRPLELSLPLPQQQQQQQQQPQQQAATPKPALSSASNAVVPAADCITNPDRAQPLGMASLQQSQQGSQAYTGAHRVQQQQRQQEQQQLQAAVLPGSESRCRSVAAAAVDNNAHGHSPLLQQQQEQQQQQGERMSLPAPQQHAGATAANAATAAAAEAGSKQPSAAQAAGAAAAAAAGAAAAAAVLAAAGDAAEPGWLLDPDLQELIKAALQRQPPKTSQELKQLQQMHDESVTNSQMCSRSQASCYSDSQQQQQQQQQQSPVDGVGGVGYGMLGVPPWCHLPAGLSEADQQRQVEQMRTMMQLQGQALQVLGAGGGVTLPPVRPPLVPSVPPPQQFLMLQRQLMLQQQQQQQQHLDTLRREHGQQREQHLPQQDAEQVNTHAEDSQRNRQQQAEASGLPQEQEQKQDQDQGRQQLLWKQDSELAAQQHQQEDTEEEHEPTGRTSRPTQSQQGVQLPEATGRVWQLLPSITESPRLTASRASSQQPSAAEQQQQQQQQQQQWEQRLEQVPEEGDEQEEDPASAQLQHLQHLQTGCESLAHQQQQQQRQRQAQRQGVQPLGSPLLSTADHAADQQKPGGLQQQAPGAAAADRPTGAQPDSKPQPASQQQQQQQQERGQQCGPTQPHGSIGQVHSQTQQSLEQAPAAAAAAAAPVSTATAAAAEAPAAPSDPARLCGDVVSSSPTRSPTHSPTASLGSTGAQQQQQHDEGAEPISTAQIGHQQQQQQEHEQHEQQQQQQQLRLSLPADTEEDLIGLLVWRQQQGRTHRHESGGNAGITDPAATAAGLADTANDSTGLDAAAAAAATAAVDGSEGDTGCAAGDNAAASGRPCDDGRPGGPGPAADAAVDADADAADAAPAQQGSGWPEQGSAGGREGAKSSTAAADAAAAAVGLVDGQQPAETLLQQAGLPGGKQQQQQQQHLQVKQAPEGVLQAEQQPGGAAARTCVDVGTSAAAMGHAALAADQGMCRLPAAGTARQPVPLFWQTQQQQQQREPEQQQQQQQGLEAALPVVAAAPRSPAVLEPSIGVGTQLAMQGLEDLCRTPSSGGAAAAGLRALSRADAAALDSNSGHDHHTFGYMQDAVNMAMAGGSTAGAAGRTTRGRGGRGGRARGGGRGAAGNGGQGGHKAAGRGRTGSTTGGGGGGKKRSRSRSTTPSLEEPEESAGLAAAGAGAGAGALGVAGGTGARAPAAAAAGGDEGLGMRRSKRATAGKKPKDIMFTQAEYLDFEVSPPRAPPHHEAWPQRHVSPLSATRQPLQLWTSSLTGLVPAAAAAAADGGAAGGCAAQHSAQLPAVAPAWARDPSQDLAVVQGSAVVSDVGRQQQQLQQREDVHHHQHQQQQQQQEGVFKVPAPPNTGHKRGRSALTLHASPRATATAGAAAASATGSPCAAVEQQQPSEGQQRPAAGARVQHAGEEQGIKRQRSASAQHAAASAAAAVTPHAAAEERHAAAAAGQGGSSNVQPAAAPQQTPAAPGTHGPANQQQMLPGVAAAAVPAAAAAGGQMAPSGASPDVVLQGTRADQLPVSSAYYAMVLTSAASRSESSSQGSAGSSGIGKKKTSRKSMMMSMRQSAAAAEALGAAAVSGLQISPGSAGDSDAAGGAGCAAAAAPEADGGSSAHGEQEGQQGAPARAAPAGSMGTHGMPAVGAVSHTPASMPGSSLQQQDNAAQPASGASPSRVLRVRQKQQGVAAAAAAAGMASPPAAGATAAAAGDEPSCGPGGGQSGRRSNAAELAGLAFPAAAPNGSNSTPSPAPAAPTATVKSEKQASNVAGAAAAAGGGAGGGASAAQGPVRTSPRRNAARGSRAASGVCCSNLSPRAAAAMVATACPAKCSARSSSGSGREGFLADAVEAGPVQSAGEAAAGPVVLVALASDLADQTKALAGQVVKDLGGSILVSRDDRDLFSVTHLLAAQTRSTVSFKLLLVLARGVPVLNAMPWLSACRSRQMVVPAERANFLMGKDLLSAKGINNMTLFDAHTRAQAELAQGRTLLCGLPCLLSPAALADKTTAESLKLLLRAAGGVMVEQPHQLLQQQQQQQVAPEHGDQASLVVRQDGRPYGLILVAVMDQEAPAGAAAAKASGSSGGRSRRSTGGGGGGSGGSRQLGKETVCAKDVMWGRECGFGGWPVYSKEWLIRSVLSFRPDWGGYCGCVPGS